MAVYIALLWYTCFQSYLNNIYLVFVQVTWDDIGGNDEVKQQLKEVVQWPRLFKDSLARIGAIPPRGRHISSIISIVHMYFAFLPLSTLT